jgi:hypothetical protein
MPLRKYPVQWQTGAGGTGLSVFYTAFGVDVTTELGTWFNALRFFHPTAVSWSIPGSGDIIDETTGEITGAWTGGTAASITATGAAAYAAGTGAFVRWGTAGIVAGRRVKGRTFLCPAINSSYESDGTILNSSVTTINTATTTLVGAGKLMIWHRPTGPGASDGSGHLVVSGQVADKVTSLRTRRS